MTLRPAAFGALAFCLITVGEVAAQPTGRVVALSDVTSPLAAFADAEFQYQRADGEHEAGGRTSAAVPIVSVGMIDDGSIRFTPRALLFAPLYRYDDLQDSRVDAVELMRSSLETHLNGLILPAARNVERLPDFAFERIVVFVTDQGGVVPYANRWNPATAENPTVEGPYGLTHALGHLALLLLQFDRVFLPPAGLDGEPEALAQGLSRWGNAYVQVWTSALQRQVDGRQFLDRGALEALFPIQWETRDFFIFRTHMWGLSTIAMAHEACHHVLGHTSRPASTSRLEQELEADRCAADIYVALQPRFAADGKDQRLTHYVSAALYVSLTGFVTWPTELASSASYSDPSARHRNVMEAIPEDVRALDPAAAAEVLALPPLTIPLDALAFLEPGKPPLPLIESGESVALDIYDTLEGFEAAIAKEMQTLDCGQPQGHGPRTSYFCGRLAADRAAVIVEMAFMLSAHEDLSDERRVLVEGLIDLAQGVADAQSAPILAVDVARLRLDLGVLTAPGTDEGEGG